MPKLRIPKVNCATCLRRPSCKTLCAAAERYADQDNIYAHEINLPDVLYQRHPSQPGDMAFPFYLSDRDLIIAVLESAGIPRATIREYLALSPARLRKIIQRLRQKFNKGSSNGQDPRP